ncbi:MAG TPA: hypothetical protein PKJ16_04935 [Spirochaetota bacterium]|nr:hypothetical protein [Spirochaetota bacterium]HOS39244.1 hypothetical protein [Spirochaetota bacterium]HPU89500.1 hypothetical protein [Spirochaetota bacterium]
MIPVPRLAIASGTCAFALAAIILACGSPQKTARPVRTLMIPPFQNQSGVEANDHLAVGVADELARRMQASGIFRSIDPAGLFDRLTISQVYGTAKEEQQLLGALRTLDTDYAVLGTVSTADKGKTMTITAKVIRSRDNTVLASEREEGPPANWTELRGLLAIKIAKRLGIPLTAQEKQQLVVGETRDHEAFRLNYIGKMQYYRSLEARYRSREVEAERYRNIAMAYWSKSIERDGRYEAARDNYARAMDVGDVRSSLDARVERAQGSLNGMIMYGFLYKSSKVWDPTAWVRANADVLRAMANTLPQGYVIEVQGHTCCSGPEEPRDGKPGNIRISDDRAREVYQAMVGIGIKGSLLRHKGYGSSRTIPWLDPRDQSNRRVTFEVKPGL